MGRRLALHGLDEIYVSSSNRAIQTAQPAAEMLGLTPKVLDWTNEDHAWAQLTRVNEQGNRHWLFQDEMMRPLLASREMQELGFRWYDHPRLAGKGYDEGINRIQREAFAFLGELGYPHREGENGYIAQQPNEKRVALFAHHGFGLAFLSCILDIPYPEFATRFDMNHTGLTVIEFSGEQGSEVLPRLMMLSGESHLYKEGLPLRYQNGIYI